MKSFILDVIVCWASKSATSIKTWVDFWNIKTQQTMHIFVNYNLYSTYHHFFPITTIVYIFALQHFNVSVKSIV